LYPPGIPYDELWVVSAYPSTDKDLEWFDLLSSNIRIELKLAYLSPNQNDEHQTSFDVYPHW
jgi:hypothetical protein